MHEAALPGVVFAGSAFLIWGLSPVYWKAFGRVGPLEIVMHRIVWSFAFLMPIIFLLRQWHELVSALANRRTLLVLATSALLVALNWLIYIWAVNNGYLLQASLGYYINPLVNVVLGMAFLRERLRRPQMAAVLLAATGVIYLTVQYGQFPWISLVLAFSFGLYGLIRKVAPVSSLVGLTVETMLMSVPALAYLLFLGSRQRGSIFRGDAGMDLLLMSTALMTAVPLLLFTAGARRITLSTLGLMQYLAPGGMFLLAVLYYREPFASAQLWTFVMIWTALAIYSTDSLKVYRREHRSAVK
jgi:chloramphenicol-sensitive protein RarD